MNISPADLEAEYKAAVKLWPFVHSIEAQFGLPPYCLFAVGSRETNLDPRYTTGTVGDNGHGHGVLQYDDRSHKIPSGFDTNALAQFTMAAGELAGLIHQFGEDGGYDAYNSGRPVDADTTGKDYGPDVIARRLYLFGHYGVPEAFQLGGTPNMVSINETAQGTLVVSGQDKDGHPLVFLHGKDDPWDKWAVIDLTDAVHKTNPNDPRLYTVA